MTSRKTLAKPRCCEAGQEGWLFAHALAKDAEITLHTPSHRPLQSFGRLKILHPTEDTNSSEIGWFSTLALFLAGGCKVQEGGYAHKEP